MQETPPGSRAASPAPIDTPVHRFSRRLQGLSPELGPLATVMMPATGILTQAAGATPAHYTLQTPRVPKAFHGDLFEDVEDWFLHFERVAAYNQWDDAAKLRNVYFSLEDGARTWFENREEVLTSWREFRRRLLEAYTSADRRERAERAIQSRVQLPNESVQMYVEDMTRLFRRADPAMPEEKKLRHLMRGVKEQLFAGLVRSPPSTVAAFLSEATTMEKVLQQRCASYDRPVHAAAVTSSFATIGQHPDDLRELIRTIVREELHKFCSPSQPALGSISALVREEVQQAFRGPVPVVDVPPLPGDYHRPTYAEVARRPAPASPPPIHATPQAPRPSVQPVQYFEDRRAPLRKADVWRTPNRRPLCFHCGEPGHLYRNCYYRRIGIQGFRTDSPRPRQGERPPEIEEFLADQRNPSRAQRQSRSPSPRRSSPTPPGFSRAAPGRSPSPRREN